MKKSSLEYLIRECASTILSEINKTEDDNGQSIIAVGAPGSLARIKSEYPKHIAILAQLFGKVTSKMEQDNIIAAAREMAGQVSEETQIEPYDAETDTSQPAPRERTEEVPPKK